MFEIKAVHMGEKTCEIFALHCSCFCLDITGILFEFFTEFLGILSYIWVVLWKFIFATLRTANKYVLYLRYFFSPISNELSDIVHLMERG